MHGMGGLSPSFSLSPAAARFFLTHLTWHRWLAAPPQSQVLVFFRIYLHFVTANSGGRATLSHLLV